MEFFLVMISVPLFLLILLAFALFVLPRYSRLERAHSAPPVAGQVPARRDSPQAGHAPDVSAGPSYFIGWGVTLGVYATLVIALISELKVHRRK